MVRAEGRKCGSAEFGRICNTTDTVFRVARRVSVAARDGCVRHGDARRIITCIRNTIKPRVLSKKRQKTQKQTEIWFTSIFVQVHIILMFARDTCRIRRKRNVMADVTKFDILRGSNVFPYPTRKTGRSRCCNVQHCLFRIERVHIGKVLVSWFLAQSALI